MKTSDHGILIHRASYSETSLLVTLLSKTHGLSTYLFQGGKKKKGNILYPLAHVEFTSFRRNDSTMGKISEMNLATVSHSLPFHPVKSGIAFFIAELVQHTVHQGGHSEEPLYKFLETENRWLDASDELANYPLWFLAAYSQIAGVVPAVDVENPTILDLSSGKLTNTEPIHVHFLRGNWIHWMEAALTMDKTDFLSLHIPKAERVACLEGWLSHYHFHLPGMRELKSVDVVRELLA